ncbi:uncharacterized protein PADG_02815 [Paracoccidioides brasiliensis Pb18]|uniref:Uncharacterized protein n=1 Tax=Paracoccidioides brasiliensis (strain Pb18) TaxID=502780 RepID=C1G6L0_PARBD|nr:uncharacterized protein PADG_02815 [Paracoccidioides brasiliensis Pb18]EEH46717.2 hypothetical protein PADG_02815 [Paracoccidioides brasiliensis Pb18]
MEPKYLVATSISLQLSTHSAASRLKGGDCTVVSADVAKDADVKALVEACVARYGGRIDTLINNPQVACSATKAAATQFTKATVVIIYAKRGVRLKNVVVPGLIHTPLVGLLADKYVGG